MHVNVFIQKVGVALVMFVPPEHGVHQDAGGLCPDEPSWTPATVVGGADAHLRRRRLDRRQPHSPLG